MTTWNIHSRGSLSAPGRAKDLSLDVYSAWRLQDTVQLEAQAREDLLARELARRGLHVHATVGPVNLDGLSVRIDHPSKASAILHILAHLFAGFSSRIGR